MAPILLNKPPRAQYDIPRTARHQQDKHLWDHQQLRRMLAD
jgi:hypothetical protein